MLGDPSSLAPHRATDLVAAEIVTNVCETLVRLRARVAAPRGRARHHLGHARPARLDPDAARGSRFHDGAPLDAAAVWPTSSICGAAHLPGTRRARGPARAPDHARPAERRAAFDAVAALLRDPEPARARGAPEPPVGTGPFASPRAGRAGRARPCTPLGGRPPPPAPGVSPLRRREALAGARRAERSTSPRRWAPSARRAARRAAVTIDSQAGLNLAFLPSTTSAAPSRTCACGRPSPARSIATRSCGAARRARRAGARALPPSLSGRTRARASSGWTARPPGGCSRRPACRAASSRRSRRRAPRPYLSTRSHRRPHPRRPRPRGARRAPARGPELGRARRGHPRGDYELALLGWQADTLDPNDFLTALLDSDPSAPRTAAATGARDGRPAEAARRTATPRSARCTARPRTCSRRTCPACRSTTRPSSPSTATRCEASSSAPPGAEVRQGMEKP